MTCLPARPRLSAAAIAMLLALVAPQYQAPAAASPRVSVLPSLARITPTTPAGDQTELSLFAARGETESFQIIVTAPDWSLGNVNVVAPELLASDGTRIGPENLVLYREHFVYISHGSPDWRGRNRPLGPGWYPDALIPFTDPATGQDLLGARFDAAPFTVAAQRSEAVWVDVNVPRAAFPGQYHGQFIVTTDQGEASVTLHLTVWGFELPSRPYLKSCFGTQAYTPDRGEELLRHRLMPRTLDGADEADLVARYGLNAANTGFWSGAGGDDCVMGPAPSVAEFRAAEGQHLPDLWLYAYTADEVGWCTDLYGTIRQWARNMHQTRIQNLITMAPVPELYDDGSGTGRSAVDVWVLLPKLYDTSADRVAYVLAKGDLAWSYNCLVQDDYSPKWEIDFAPINYRIQPGFINQSLGLTGLLYWHVDSWATDPWINLQGMEGYPGEGLLLYPGEDVGLSVEVPSIRLKWLRDGVDDYDYIEMLKLAGLGELAMPIVRMIGPDWTNWTRDPVALEAARRQLGEWLNGALGDIDFLDVPGTYWAFDEIRACFRHNIVQGFENHMYAPTMPVTRDQMAVYIARAIAGGDAYVPTAPEHPTFVDVGPNHWAYKYIEYAHSQDIVEGYQHGRYAPGQEVDRAQMAAFVARSIVTPKGDGGLDGYEPPETPTFRDVTARHWAYKYIEYLAERSVVQGFADGTYQPLVSCTRDQMAVYLARAFGLVTMPPESTAARPNRPPALPGTRASVSPQHEVRYQAPQVLLRAVPERRRQ